MLPVGKLTVERMHALADVAARHGDGDIRLTVWQNLILSGVADGSIPAVVDAIRAMGLAVDASSIRAGLVACTGSVGCKFAAADTKATADEIAAHVEARLSIDAPVNVHVTGCHHSCAQHYIGDIGLVGARVPVGDDGDTVDGYDVVLGGGYGTDAAIGRDVLKGVRRYAVPAVVERLLAAWIDGRRSTEESFQAFTARHDVAALAAIATAGGEA